MSTPCTALLRATGHSPFTPCYPPLRHLLTLPLSLSIYYVVVGDVLRPAPSSPRDHLFIEMLQSLRCAAASSHAFPGPLRSFCPYYSDIVHEFQALDVRAPSAFSVCSFDFGQIYEARRPTDFVRDVQAKPHLLLYPQTRPFHQRSRSNLFTSLSSERLHDELGRSRSSFRDEERPLSQRAPARRPQARPPSSLSFAHAGVAAHAWKCEPALTLVAALLPGYRP